MRRSGVSSSKSVTRSTHSSAAMTRARSPSARRGRPGPFRRLTDASVLSATTSRSPSALAAWSNSFITVTVDSSKHYHSFIDHARAADEVLEIHSVTGSGTHLLKVRTENTSSLEKLLSKIQAWSGVVNT
ncbi:MAG: Lrp/AsnC ligand binding domain-containing protein, partial [Candidatus Sumerlaeia bacterium]|nr:Lrp/AsnC ligand binding domain-containing protein [Candidatus Sumerlaeia bacterium]